MVPPTRPVGAQPVMHGKLLEIDLGEEARARNVALTERARRRLQGLSTDDDGEESSGPPKKVRLGRDGKPWRGRNRRGSDDIKRDQLVEEFLKENRCTFSSPLFRLKAVATVTNGPTVDVYDVPADGPGGSAGQVDKDAAADDRIAEEFRREFMDAISQRAQRRRPALNAPPKPSAKATAKEKEEILRGPKLGGSRNSRAAMRDALLKEQEKKRR
jgi:hypothetical protein